jgi:hypothetical protein
MQHFARALLLTLGLGTFVVVLSFYPSQPAAAAPGATSVIVTNTPLPVTGNVNANITNASIPVSHWPSTPDCREWSGRFSFLPHWVEEAWATTSQILHQSCPTDATAGTNCQQLTAGRDFQKSTKSPAKWHFSIATCPFQG